MKTPEEIKKGLECCYSPVEPMLRCEACPYNGSIVCKMRLHTDALDYIQRLEAQVPKWISVEERLPSEGVSVAVYINEGNGAYWIQTSYLNGGKWRIPGEFVVDRNITHWMPLPEPPEEE